MPEQDDIAQGLSQLGETTTAGELLRQKGQTRKLRVISEKKLMEWILLLLKQHMAGKEDVFSDVEKTELLKQTQDELNKRIKRDQEAQAERDRLKNELAQAMAAVQAQTSGEHSAPSQELERALGALKQKLEEAEQINLDLQQDNYDLQDQLNEKMALLSTTIAEKDKLNGTVQKQMRRMTDLVSAVMSIDGDYYGNRHQEENPPPDDMPEEDLFYHDFDVAPKVIISLLADLERLRGIVKAKSEAAQAAEYQATEQAAAAAAEGDKPKLLAADLALLEALKSGSLEAIDVAAPVASLIEALDGARAEGEAFELQVAEATGGTGHAVSFTELPDAGGDPNHVLAGAATVARELAAALARNRNRIAALKQIADEADEARNSTELELEDQKAAFERVCTALRQRAESDKVELSSTVIDREAHPDKRAAGVIELLDHLHGDSPVDVVAVEQLALTDRLIKQVQGVSAKAAQPQADTTDRKAVAERLRKAGQELERYTLDLQRQLDDALVRERGLAEKIHALASAQHAAAAAGHDADLQLEEAPSAAVAALGQSLDSKADPQVLAEVTIKALESVAADAKRASIQAAFAEDRALAIEIVKGAQGDARLAEHLADLAVAVDGDVVDHPELGEQVRQALALVLARKAELESEVQRLAAEADSARMVTGDADVELNRLEAQVAANQAELAKLQSENLGLRSAKQDLATAMEAVFAELKVRSVQNGRDVPADISDPAREPAIRARAALHAISIMSDQKPAEEAALDCLRCIDRLIARGGQRNQLTEGLKPGDSTHMAERLRTAAREMEKFVVTLNQELEDVKSSERALATETTRLAAEVEAVRSERAAAVARAEAAERARIEESGRLNAELKRLHASLVEAEADVEERVARNDATSVHFKDEVGSLRKEAGDLRAKAKEAEAIIAGLKHSVDGADVRLNRQREELTKRLEERDRVIEEKDGIIDRLTEQRADANALEAKVQALKQELAGANDKIRDLETRFGEHAGDVAKAGDLSAASRQLAANRDQLREQKRQVEADLAESQAVADELRTEVADLRKEAQEADARHAQELVTERERSSLLKEEFRKLKEEVLGLRARLRKLTEPGK